MRLLEVCGGLALACKVAAVLLDVGLIFKTQAWHLSPHDPAVAFC